MANRQQLESLVYFLVIVLGGMSAGGAEIYVKPECRPAGRVVRLGDVADVFDGDASAAKELAEIELFSTLPSPRTLPAAALRRLLVARRVDLARCRFSGASSVTILPCLDEAPSREAPAATAVYLPAAAPDGGDVRPAAFEETVPLIVSVVRDLPRGHVISEDDLAIVPAASQAVSALGFTSPDEVVGQELARPARAGGPLTRGDVRPPILVNRNDVVTVYSLAGNVRVRTSARAADEGAMGDFIELVSLDRRSRFRRPAQVVASGVVEIRAASPQTPAGFDSIRR